MLGNSRGHGKRKYNDCEKSSKKSKKSRPNRGRSEYRVVQRTAKRKPIEEESTNNHTSESESEEETGEGEERFVEITDKEKAYDALLTLLSHEQVEDDEDDEDEDEGLEATPIEQDRDNSPVEGEQSENVIAGFVEHQEEDEIEEEPDDDSDEEDDDTDPFESHFANAAESYVEKCVTALESGLKWTSRKELHDTYSCMISTPPTETKSKLSKSSNSHSLGSYKIKDRVLEPFLEKYGEKSTGNDVAKLILDPMFSYGDVLFPYGSFTKRPAYRRLYLLHCLNHVYKTRDRILKDNVRIANQNEGISNGTIKPEDEKEFRDQGFTRPKVLILLPSRAHCYKAVEEMMRISGVNQVDNQKKFKSEFFDDSPLPDNKPDDFKDLFGGNSNDFFCLGIKFTRKSMKLYSSFYNSDIIFASPIGLQMILENPDKKKQESDFLSSIEILVVDQAHAIELQNWDHIFTIFKYLNKIPKNSHDTDFGRVRMWSIEDRAKYFTQSLIFTEYNSPNINNVITRSMNIFGKYRFRQLIPNVESAMFKVGLKINQMFRRFDSSSPIDDPDARFHYFKSVLVPSLSNSTNYEDGLLLYIPSYTDFLKIKNYLHEKTSLLFTDINEYSSQGDLNRGRALFQQGKRKILLYTERLHHYRRFEIKGVKNILMYGPPSNPLFYTEIVSFIGRSVYEGIADFDISKVRVVYSKWDALALERIVGSDRAPVLTHGQNELYEFR